MSSSLNLRSVLVMGLSGLVASGVLAEDVASKSSLPEVVSQGAAGEPTAEVVLERAFANRYDCDTTARIELVMRARNGGERRRIFQTATKRVNGRMRSFGRLVEPPYLRGMGVLTIEAEGRAQDTFVYLPSMGKVRRVTSAQRADSFLGSDFTYEDFENRRVTDFEVGSMETTSVEGETVYRVKARPLRVGSYERIEFDVAKSDWALLVTRYYKRGADEPFRVIDAPRSGMVEQDGHVLPTILTARNALRSTTTEVWITQLRVNPEIDPHLFTVGALEREAKLE